MPAKNLFDYLEGASSIEEFWKTCRQFDRVGRSRRCCERAWGCDLAVLTKRSCRPCTTDRSWCIAQEAFEWYLDLRRYGSVPHGGFGMGVERVVGWICGLEHVRETIPYPRMLYRCTHKRLEVGD